MRKIAWVVLSVALAGCSAPQDNPEETRQAGAEPAAGEHVALALTPQQQEGKMLYESMCWGCHGQAGRGDGPATASADIKPPTFHTKDYARADVDDLTRRFRSAMDGVDENHPHMQYVASVLQPDKFAAALSYVPALAYPPELPGSTLAGERIYKFRCVGCHGATGRGDGPASPSLTTVKPADFTADTLLAKKDWDALFARIREGGQGVHGSSMPPWGVVLSEAEIWDLIAYLATFQEGLLSKPAWEN